MTTTYVMKTFDGWITMTTTYVMKTSVMVEMLGFIQWNHPMFPNLHNHANISYLIISNDGNNNHAAVTMTTITMATFLIDNRPKKQQFF